MAAGKKLPKIIPSPLSPNRTIVIIILVVIIAIIAIVIGLSLTAHNPSTGGSYSPSSPSTHQNNGTSPNPAVNGIRLDSYSYQQSPSTGVTTFNVTLTNSKETSGSATVVITVGGQNSNATPNQPYSGRQPAPSNPTFTAAQNVTLAAGETRSVPVAVQTPSWFSVQPSAISVVLI